MQAEESGLKLFSKEFQFHPQSKDIKKTGLWDVDRTSGLENNWDLGGNSGKKPGDNGF